MQLVTTLADSGAGSLRAAIAAAGLGEEIQFTVTGTINLTTGELAITQDVIITGPGFSFLTIATTHAQRIFNVIGGVIDITGLTMTGGNPVFDPFGGIIKNSGTIRVLSDCIIQGGQAIDGGGIYNLGTIQLMKNCLVQLNGCTGGDPNARGGGIWNDGTITMEFCSVDSNNVNGATPVQGGGIWNDGTVTATYCNITNNTTTGYNPFGGGIYSEGTVTLTQCTVDQNFVTGSINGAPGQGGGIVSLFGTLTVEFSTVSNNVATGFGVGTTGGNAQGGGIYTAQGNSTYINSSTVSSNQCLAGNGSSTNGVAEGGAVWMDNAGAVQVNNSTLPLNSSGCYITFGVTFLPYDSIIAGNVTNDIEGNQPGLFAFTSQGHCIFGTQTVPYNIGAGDLIILTLAGLKIGPLELNGGTTQTHALQFGSPAIDAGDNTSAPATDQRGGPRILNSIIDIGSFESAPLIEFCVDAGTYCQTLTNPTAEEIAAAQAAVNAQALADAEAQAGTPTSCCTPPYFTTETHTGSLTNPNTQRFSFSATAGKSLSFWVTSPDGDIGLKLYDTDGVTELYRDSAPEEDQRGLYLRYPTALPHSAAGITYTFPTTDTYFIDAECWGSDGSFSLVICAIDQPGETTTRYQYASTYVATTKKIFIACFGETPGADANVNIVDAYSGELINTVAVSKHGINTGVGRLIFYNANDDSVWVNALYPPTGDTTLVRLDPVRGVPIETFLPPAITNTILESAIYCPANNHFYIASATPATHQFVQVEIFDCSTRTWGTPVSISGAPAEDGIDLYAYDPGVGKVYVIVNYSSANLLTSIDTATDTGATIALATDFSLHSAYPPVLNGLLWGTCGALNRMGTLDPALGVFTAKTYNPAAFGMIGAIAYDPCRNLLVTTGSRIVTFSNLPAPGFPWGVGYFARIQTDGTWIESGIVDALRFPITNFVDQPIWIHPLWNPITSRMACISTYKVFQV